MNTSRLILGILFLALAGLLAVLNVTLPADKMAFMIGDSNMPFVPVVILAILGAVFTVAAMGGSKIGQEETKQENHPKSIDPEKAALNKRLEAIGWGLFLIMLGGFSLVPNELIPKGVWSIGVGVIMLGLNLARYVNRLKMSGFTTFLGVISLLSGILQLSGMQMLEGAFLLIILGAYLLIKPWFDRRQLFGKAEVG